MRVAITGSNGCIGQNLCNALKNNSHKIRQLVRYDQHNSIDSFSVGDISHNTDWSKALEDVDCIIHCAGLAHNLHRSKNLNLTSFEEINVLGTINLAEQASRLGVNRMVFLSSLKVNGDLTTKDCPFTEKSVPKPRGEYAQSKWDAEQKLREISSNSKLDVITVRPPLVYGPGVKANFLYLLKAVSLGLPLPLGSIDNRRSFISVDNLTDFLIACITKPEACGETFLVSDDEDISTSYLIESMEKLMNKPSRLFYLPKKFMLLGGFLINKENMIRSLVDSLQVDISYTKKTLSWEPKYTLQESLKNTIDSFL